MRRRAWAAWLVGAFLAGCASAPPPPPPPLPAQPVDEHEKHAAAEEPPAVASAAGVDAPERSRPPSTASYEEALSSPEALDVNDDRVQLNDAQLTGPMRGVLSGCRAPPNARVTVKTAVQNGRAIGVSVNVRFERPRSARRPTRAAVKAEVKAAAKIVACVDRAVRAVTWPPSSRRDSFTTEF